MAENLLEALHTNHKKAEALMTPSNLVTEINAIAPKRDIFVQQETRLYDIFGCKDYISFRNKFRNFIHENKQDREVLKRFKKDYLDASLRNYQPNRQMSQQEVYFDFQIDQSKNNIDLPNEFKNIGGNKFRINIGYDIKKLKQMLNLFKNKGYFNIESKSSGAALKFLQEEIDKEGTITLTDGSDVTSYIHNFKAETRFPWGADAAFVEAASTDNNEESYARKLLYEAYEEIRNYIVNVLGAGASPQLKSAIEIVYDEKIRGNTEPDLRFFAKSGVPHLIAGALGEFQTAVILVYFKNAFNINTSNPKIMGDVFTEGTSEQAKADLLFNGMGIQVKNYRETSKTQIATNIHPKSFSEYFNNENTQQDFLFFLANYYFNEDYANNHDSDFSSLKQEIEKFIGEMMSLQTQEIVEPSRVAFYFISGQYLVPGSVLVDAIRNIKDKSGIYKTSITSSQTPLPSEELAKKYPKYWINGQPQTENQQKFNNLVSSAISIRQQFDYRTLLEQELKQYSLLDF